MGAVRASAASVLLYSSAAAAAALLLLLLLQHRVSATSFTVQNRCNHPVWPGIQPSAGKPLLAKGGFALKPGEVSTVHAPSDWSGRIWGRQGCSFDGAGEGSCATGDCGGLFCNGAGGAPPATLAEFTFGARDFYDVSLVDGYNLPMTVAPRGGRGKCKSAGCVSDLNARCPPSLQVRRNGRVVGCKSACSALGGAEYCCTGSYANPSTCTPTAYSRLFKAACPTAYSYAYDDPSSILTCSASNYLLIFCL